MKNVDIVVKNRIEKHLDIVEHNKAYYTEAEVLNTSVVLPAVTTTTSEEEKDTDFRYARENMYHIIERGRDAMDELLEIAKSEESPRAFEVFGQLLKNMTDTQEKLMELHRKKQIIENNGERQEVTKAQNVTNALFVGSTAELLKLVKKETKVNKE